MRFMSRRTPLWLAPAPDSPGSTENYWTITGGVFTQGFFDTLIDRGTITGVVGRLAMM